MLRAWTTAAVLLVGCASPPAPASAPAPRAEAPPRPAPEPPAPEPAAPEPAAPAAAAPAPPLIRILPDDEDAIDEAVHRALAAGAAPGCVVVIGRADGVVFRRAYGRRAVDPEDEPMTSDTVFDLASLTKAVATATSVMVLAERGALDLDAPVSAHLPELRDGDRITARHLLTHTSGLPAVNPLRDYDPADRAASLARIFETPLEHPPGARVHYSDLGFIVLGELVGRVAGEPLDAFAQGAIFGPLGMADTGFRPPDDARPRVAPTERAERRGGIMIRGVVHDPRAWRLGGLAGHAGLFSSADDLARFAEAMLRGGAPVLEPRTLDAMTAPARFVGGRKALGWDVGRPGLGPRAYGHGGYTGTALSIDPDAGVYVLLLSNRVHPDGDGDVSGLARALNRLGAEAAARALPPRASPVLAGIDALERDGFGALDGARVALLTHRAARTRDGRRTLDVLHAAPNVALVRLWAPEHGLAGRREGRVGDAREPRTGLPVHSLFGRTRTPTDAMLEGVDTVVVDLQDVGVRFYTYASTVRRVLEAAAARDLRVVILDRPDPLGGLPPAGPVSEEALASFVNHHPLPPRHGMTLGELAGLLNEERAIGARLEVVEVEGWRRGQRWSDAGLRWVPPSPNLRTPEQVQLYPALALLEGTEVSVGRGTDAPFELLGAPWIDGEALAAALGAQPGVTIAPTRFRPTASRHRGARCGGIRVTLDDAAALRPVRLGFAIAQALARLYPDRWDGAAMERMVGHRAIHRRLLAGEDLDALERAWRPELEAFARRRAAHLRYD